MSGLGLTAQHTSNAFVTSLADADKLGLDTSVEHVQEACLLEYSCHQVRGPLLLSPVRGRIYVTLQG